MILRGIIWFREDLRIFDNTALCNATQMCTDGLVAIYIIDTSMWLNHHVAACKVEFILRGLTYLQADLEKLHIPLLIKQVDSTNDIAHVLFHLAEKIQAKKIFFNRQYEVNENRRDQFVQSFLNNKNIFCHLFDDQAILPPGSVMTQKGEFYKVFTAFKHAWYREFSQQGKKSLLKPHKTKPIENIHSSTIPTSLSSFKSSVNPDLWPSGEKNANKRLDYFIEDHLFLYHNQRDFPALKGTSQLSPYLASGMISARYCFLAALTKNKFELDTGNKGAITWMSELIWRDFYKHILYAVPHISMNQPFQPETKQLKWKFDTAQLNAWQNGQTGFPIIDAAMRQLNTIGWMHNRLRMIVAMFFTKNLFFDWRIGEKYFISHLIDGDLSANNGGWQWCASTGTDAVPYFRIFNPIRQSERFDPEGHFIRQYCPELVDCDNKSIHAPFASLVKNIHYPKPIVNLEVTRKQAIQAFKNIKKKPHGITHRAKPQSK